MATAGHRWFLHAVYGPYEHGSIGDFVLIVLTDWFCFFVFQHSVLLEKYGVFIIFHVLSATKSSTRSKTSFLELVCSVSKYFSTVVLFHHKCKRVSRGIV